MSRNALGSMDMRCNMLGWHNLCEYGSFTSMIVKSYLKNTEVISKKLSCQ